MDDRPNLEKFPDPASTESSLWLVVVSRWRFLLAMALAGGLAAFGLSFLIRPLYEARATLVLSLVDSSPAGQTAAVTNTRTLLESRTLARQVIEAFGLQQPPYSIHPDQFTEQLLRVAQIRDTNYLRVTLRLPSPDLAAKALNALVEKGIELNRQLTLESTTSVTRGLLRNQLDEARAALDRRTKELEEFRASTQLEVLRKDVEQLTNLRSVITDLDGEIASERARIVQIEQQLATRPRVLEVPRRSDGEGALLEHSRLVTETEPRPGSRGESVTPPKPAVPELKEDARTSATARGTARAPARGTAPTGQIPPVPAAPPQRAKERLEPPPGLSTMPPFVDPVFEVLDYQLATARHRLAALQAQRTALAQKGSGPLGPLYAGEARLARLELEHELAAAVYKELSVRFEEARENTVSRSAGIQIADAAVPPSGSIAPNRRLLAALGASFGLLAAMTIAFVVPFRAAA